MALRLLLLLFYYSVLVACQMMPESRGFNYDDIVLNHYDDAWEDQWVIHLRSIYQKAHLLCANNKKTPGFVVHLGDSMTYAYSYGNVSEYGVQKFQETVDWSKSPSGGELKDGWALARFDHPKGGRSYTAVSGITAHDFLHFGVADPVADDCSHQGINAPTFVLMKQPESVCKQIGQGNEERQSANQLRFSLIKDSVIAIILLGSNDVSQGRDPEAIIEDISLLVKSLMNLHIMPVLSTIPPRKGFEYPIFLTNQKIKHYAQTQGLPLIGFAEEVLRRRPNQTWFGTLISTDGVHPSAGVYHDPSISPNILNDSGYTLRGYLSVLKLKEIREKVVIPLERESSTCF